MVFLFIFITATATVIIITIFFDALLLDPSFTGAR
jgi:hypothetical protein